MKKVRLAFLLPCLLSVSPVARAAERAPETVTLALPRLHWVLEIGAPGFVLTTKERIDSNGSARLFGSNEKTGVMMSAFLEKADHPGDAKECRAFYWEQAKKSPMKKDDFSMSESGGMAILEYIVKEFAGVKVHQKNMNVYLSRDGYWVDIHLSKVKFKPDEESLFKDILNAVSIRPTSALSQSPTARYYGLPEHGSIALDVPESWTDTIRWPKGDTMPPTIVFAPLYADEFSIMITPRWRAKGEADFNRMGKLRSHAENSGKKLLESSVEKKLVLKEFHGPATAGYYYSLTDRAPTHGGWAHLTQGFFGIEDLMVFFTVLTKTEDSPSGNAAIEMLRKMRRQGETSG